MFMTFKRLLTACVLLLMTLTIGLVASAQEKVVTGKVTDSKNGQPIGSVSVTVKGSRTGTQTAADGSFKISASSTATLVFTNVAYEKAEVSVGSNSVVNVSLVAASSSLTDVVVIGYGTRKIKDLTGSVSNVTAKDFNKGQIASPEQLLQGRTAGVLVTPWKG